MSVHGSSGDECEGDDEDSSSRSLSRLSLQNQELKADALESFRQQWQRELESSPQRRTNNSTKQDDGRKMETKEKEATELFVRGVECERHGALDEAVWCYRRALQLVPDIERRLHQTGSHRPQPVDGTTESELEEYIEDTALREGSEDYDVEDDLYTKIQKIVECDGKICHPENEIKGCHMSLLPLEVVLLMLRWVVGSELDATSLVRLGEVCRGLYLASWDPQIWRSLCIRTWGHNCGVLKGTPWSSWRQMYAERTRLRFSGCYISKTSYLRHGENSFQDTFYKPWYLVQYFRYLRFFPDGTVLMLTTAEEPASCVGLLKSKSIRLDQPVLSGHYRLVADKVLVVVKKQSDKKQAQSNTRFRSRRNQVSEQSQQTFHLELQICAYKNRRNAQLIWTGYKVSVRNKSGSETSTAFELGGPRFPPFWFSTVRSYHAESESPL